MTPWYALTVEQCDGRLRFCPSVDPECQKRVEADGYVQVTQDFAYCKKDQVRTVPTNTGVIAGAVVVTAVAVLLIRLRKRLRRKR